MKGEEWIALPQALEEMGSVGAHCLQWGRSSPRFPLPPTSALRLTNQALPRISLE